MSGADIRQAVVAEEATSGRLDKMLVEVFPDLSRSRLQALVRDGQVTVDGAVVEDPKRKVGAGMTLGLTVPPALPATPLSENIPLTVVYEDEDLIVIDKPAGLVVHPGAGHGAGTLVNALINHCGDSLSGIGGVKRPGIVHRLDKDTSGLLVVAKNDRAHRHLADQFADHGRSGPLVRAYIAFVWGGMERKFGTIDAILARSVRNREKIEVVRTLRRPEEQEVITRGRQAITHYTVEEIFKDAAGTPVATQVRCTLETGRTHQIRVHMAHISHPLMGDHTYGSGFITKAAKLEEPQKQALAALGRQALHAAVLGFEHPRSGEAMYFESPLPADIQELRHALKTA